MHRCSTAIWFPLPYAHLLLIFGRDKEHRLGPRPQTPSTCRPLAEGNGEPVPLLEDCPSLAYHHAITSIHTSRSANYLTIICTPTRLSPEPRQAEDRAAVQAPSCLDKASGKGRKRAATLCAFFGGRHWTTSLGTRNLVPSRVEDLLLSSEQHHRHLLDAPVFSRQRQSICEEFLTPCQSGFTPEDVPSSRHAAHRN